MASGDIQDFYRQKKRGGRSAVASKSSAGKKQKTQKSSSGKSAGASLGSHTAQPPALHESSNELELYFICNCCFGNDDDFCCWMIADDCEKQEDMLQQFDLNMRYGPCMGISRLARWERAQNLGLNPPKDVESLLRGGKVQLQCVWDGRV
ncbi:hypothetical protein ACLOJK_034124 [Asimina triloba]